MKPNSKPRDLVPLLTPAEWARTIEPYDRQLAELDSEIKRVSDAQQVASSEFKNLPTASSQILATGLIADGGQQAFESATGQMLDSIEVRAGQLITLTIDPQSNYGADTTLIDWELVEIGGLERRWNLVQDVATDFLEANPHADRIGNSIVWLFLDARSGYSLLPEPVRDLNGKRGLNVWRNGDNPSVFVNSTKDPIAVWTNLPAQSLFVHPAADGAVAIAWASPIEGRIQCRGRILDAHPGGPDGVGWKIELKDGQFSDCLQRIADISREQSTLVKRRAALVANAPLREVAYAVTEGTIGNIRMHLRGDPEKPGEEIPRGWLKLLGGQTVPNDAGSGRLQLADWLVDSQNPLTARVMVNRIWLHHFGKGLVQTPNDFGTRGQPPTHPELLDWLANQFVKSGWSIKSMHRLIMLSATYCQSTGDPSSADHSRGIEVDPNNHLYWRFDRRRLSAEELRDSLLLACQQLDLTPGGQHAIPPTSAWSYSQHVPFAGVAETDKRSIYQITVRNRRAPYMSLFDGADPNATTPQRQVTTVPTQSLYFLNDSGFHSGAERVANRVLNLTDDNNRLNELFRIIFQREPTLQERDMATAFLRKYSEALVDLPDSRQPLALWSACTRILLSSNQFLYVE